MSPVRGDDRCGIERDRAEEVQPFLFGEGFAATLLEEIDLLTAMGTEEAAHVLHKAEHVRFDDLEEIKRFADVRQRNLLRGGDDEALGVRVWRQGWSYARHRFREGNR